WCKTNNFKSMLLQDVKSLSPLSMVLNTAAVVNMQQTSLDGHLQEIPPNKVVIPYTDSLFHEAAIDWLISTSQPIQAVDHLSFKNMINIAARATNGVVLPNCNAMCRNIMDLFKTQMTKLKDRLNLSFCFV
ncbi:uncharacterized protein BJ212DRAFT_1292804, partial [Suillus subaureus]